MPIETLPAPAKRLLRPMLALGGWLWLLMGGAWVLGIAVMLKLRFDYAP